FDQWKTEYIERLLAAPQFGERWARYWLDVSRYSDTRGYVFTAEREYKDAWRYREWVIRSLNEDLPYDQFLRMQLAADRLTPDNDPATLAAMGFLTLGRRFLNNPHDIIDDRIDVTMRGMQGLTVGCARCHDHKYDPVSMADYYGLYGVFASSDEPGNDPSPLRLVDRDAPVTPVIFLRGSPGNRGDQVPRRFLRALSPDAPDFSDGSGRLELANAIASSSNPLTGRVAVNRIWMHLFGRGLVDTPSDFGVRTDRPMIPGLMDYLTVRFVESGWSRKDLIRQIVSSRTYQQSSARRVDAERVDPENRLLARMNRSRLDFEAHRDSVLAVADRLEMTVGGTSVDITNPGATPRRTIYAYIDRQNLPGVFRTFDLANPDAHAPRRFQTTVPQQALYQLNSPFIMQNARAIAQAVMSDPNAEARVRRLFRMILRREPSQQEMSAAREFLDSEVRQAGMMRSGWGYGYGPLDQDQGEVAGFIPLPHYEKGRWSGGAEFPDPELRHTMLSRSGGHAGPDRNRCTIRRWTTDIDCVVKVTSQLKHATTQGNGVRGLIVPAGRGIVAEAVAHNSAQDLAADQLSLNAGDAIDFVVDNREDSSFDSFEWRIQIQQAVDGIVVRNWNSERDFEQRQPQQLLDQWSQLAQTLMLTNEFVFVD
ncbi:MAG: DUF1553 domain-containing protein, partial [Planctomycetaceae bacterium]|nr:DUF1553 domain-containing protein [Planctomycetaceae bacterium]